MNRNVFYILSCIAGFALLASGCAGAPALPSATPLPPAATAVPTTTPTLTLTPKPTPTPTPTPSPTPHFADPQLISDIDALIAKQETELAFFGPEMTKGMVKRIQKDPSGVVASIMPRLSDENQSETALAVYAMALGYTRDPSAVDPLLKLARETDSQLVKDYCLFALEQIGGEQVGEGLLILLEEITDKEQRYSILNVLAGMHYEPALPLMGEVLEVDSNMEYWKPIFIFGKMGDMGVPYLLDRIGDENVNVRANAIYLLGGVLIVPEAAQPMRERYWVEEDPGIRGKILISLEAITPDLEEIQSFSEEVIANEKDEALVKFAQVTIDLLPELRRDVDSFISEKKVSSVDFQAEYDKLYENYGSGDKEVLARASTLADEAQLKKLRERILLRDSDEALYDYEEVNSIIKMNRRAQAIADQEGKPWEAWPTATPVPTTPPPLGSKHLPPPSQSVSGFWGTNLVFSPDGNLIAVSSLDGIVILDAATYSELNYLENGDLILDFAFSENGKQLAFSYWRDFNTSLLIWDIDAPQARLLASEIASLGDQYLGYSPDGRIIVWGVEGMLHLFDVKSGGHLENQPYLPALEIRSVAFSPDGKLLGICCSRSSIVLWNIHEGGIAGTVRGAGQVEALLFTPGGSSIIAFDPMAHKINHWDLKTLKPSQPPVELTDYPAKYESGDFRFSPDGRFLAASYLIMNGSLQNIFVVYDAQTGEPLGSMECELSCQSNAFSPDGKKLALATLEDLFVWEMSSIAK